eukprot:TRINITY_DN19046_c0_g1_i1.p1 TRINITY_DN19046_c0_g1~~TRINITY_DN19046_c0_g1_i1.p1  ORF type:complete len:1135 (-),score=127.76 TRINITY_DN19046_c0_g1_i1:87-3470(-)
MFVKSMPNKLAYSRVTLRFYDPEAETKFISFYAGPNHKYPKMYLSLLAGIDILISLYFAHTNRGSRAMLARLKQHDPAAEAFSMTTFGEDWMLPWVIATAINFLCIPLFFVKPLRPYHGIICGGLFIIHWPAFSLAHLRVHNSLPSLFALPACAGLCTLLGRVRFFLTVPLTALYPIAILAGAIGKGWLPQQEPWRLLYIGAYFATLSALQYVSELAWRRCFIQQQRVEVEVENFARDKDNTERLLCSLFPCSVVHHMALTPSFLSTFQKYSDACVVATDVMGFTSFSARVSSDTLVRFLNQMFARSDALAHRHGMQKVHTVGDAIILIRLPGAGNSCESDDTQTDAQKLASAGRVSASLLFSLDLLLIFEDIKREISVECEPPAGIRLGLHVGPLLGAFVGGVCSRLQYDIFGEAFDGATKLEQGGEPGKAHLSEKAWQMCLTDSRWSSLAQEVELAPAQQHTRSTTSSSVDTSWLITPPLPQALPPLGLADYGKPLPPLEPALTRTAFSNLARMFSAPGYDPSTEYALVEDFNFQFGSMRYRDPRTERAYRRFILSPNATSLQTLKALPLVSIAIPFGVLVLAPVSSARNWILWAVMLASIATQRMCGVSISKRAHTGLPPRTRMLVAYTLALALSCFPAFFAENWDNPAKQEFHRVLQMSSLCFLSIFFQFALFIPVLYRFLGNFLIQSCWAFAVLVSSDAYPSSLTTPYGRPGYFVLSVLVFAGAWLFVGLFLEYCFRREFSTHCRLLAHHASAQHGYHTALGTVLQLMLPPSVLLRMQAIRSNERLIPDEHVGPVGAPTRPQRQRRSRSGSTVPLTEFDLTEHEDEGQDHEPEEEEGISIDDVEPGGLGVAGGVGALGMRGDEHLRNSFLAGAAAPPAIADRVASATCVCFKVMNLSKMPAEEMAPALQQVWRVVDRLVHVRATFSDVLKVKSVGPMTLIVAGALKPAETAVAHCTTGLIVAQQLANAMQALNSRRTTPLVFTIGVHTGPIMGAVLGTTELSYDVFGDTVNVSSRMQSTAPPNSTQVTSDVVGIMGPDIFTERGEVTVKGKGQLKTFLLTGALNPVTTTSAASSGASAASAMATLKAKRSNKRYIKEQPAPLPGNTVASSSGDGKPRFGWLS